MNPGLHGNENVLQIVKITDGTFIKSTEKLYDFHSYTTEDHYRLSRLLNKSKTRWMLSYYDYPELRELYPEDKYNYYFKDFQKSSTMNKKGVRKPKATEVLVTNYTL